MRLVPYCDADLWLTEAFELDPVMMKDLGGPTPAEQIQARHLRRVETVAKGDWWFKIVPEGESRGAGTIGIWRHEREGKTISEMGWMVLPPHQGRGVATAAGRMVLSRARAENKFPYPIFAYPNVANAASNAICRKLGFEKHGERDLPFRDRMLRVADWRLGL